MYKREIVKKYAGGKADGSSLSGLRFYKGYGELQSER